MRLIHSADWQLGARFAQFRGMAQRLRQARLETLHRTIERASQLQVDALLIAGDLFADSQVEDAVIQTALDMIAGTPDLHVFILPGNHDPYTGPACIWERKPFQKEPPNVTVFSEPTVCKIADGFLVARPLQQKVSTIDPTAKFSELVHDLPADRIRVGITHGALAIPGKHQPNDFPIALNAATRSALDYLALGHWHNGQIYDGGRMAMSGTPEPDQFGQTSSGNVILVEISQRGEAPKLSNIPVSSLRWQDLEFDILDFEATRQCLIARMEEMKGDAKSTVLRVTLRGSLSPDLLAELEREIESLLQPFAAWLISNEVRANFTPGELAELETSHPILAQAIGDFAQFECLACGTPPATAPDVISLADARMILDESQIDLSKLDIEFFRVARQLLSQKLQEVS